MDVTTTSDDGLTSLFDELLAIRREILDAERRYEEAIARVHSRHRRSARNLVHYLALRNYDMRDLQERLRSMALSSLGGTEPHVLASLDIVLIALSRLIGRPFDPGDRDAVDFEEGSRLLAANAENLLGPSPGHRTTRIMVTLPSEAADDPGLAHQLVAAGMDVARLNCAHDGPEAWERMSSHVRGAARAVGRPMRIAMDLGGPKLRTGPLAPGPQVVKARPTRDPYGRVVASARVALAPPDAAPPGIAAVLVEDVAWLTRRRPGDAILLTDARGSRRRLLVEATGPDGVIATTDKTTYLTTGLALAAGSDEATVGTLPPTEQSLVLERGDLLVVTRDLAPAEVPSAPGDGPARIGCTLPEAFVGARPGERILFDDGKIEGLIQEVTPDELHVRITRARFGGAKLRAEKGINLPDTELDIAALTPKDIDDLDHVTRLADIVNLSFGQRVDDVQALQAELAARDAEHLGLVLKIETVAAFENLPWLLLAALATERVGVMIARGDLAVEAGYERLAEVQEEILWLCEAAHVPTIWATQVLDSLAKSGQPSRAEVTDAAMGVRAECVMLNKGPHIDEAIAALSDILDRMEDHHQKKRSLLRRLRAWDGGPA